MEKNIYKGNILIRRLVVLVDFIILNCLLLGFINFEFIHVPDYLDLKTKIESTLKSGFFKKFNIHSFFDFL